MASVKQRARKHDQRTRQDRRKLGQLGLEQRRETERRSSDRQQARILQGTRKNEPCDYCSSHRRCSKSDCCPEEQSAVTKIRRLRSDKDNVETCLNCHQTDLAGATRANRSYHFTPREEMLDSKETIRDTCRECHPEEFPDLNFHHSFGSFLTRKNPILDSVDHDVGRYWALLNQSPSLLQYHIHDIGDRYREAFRRFFTAEPISPHGHVSDASSPALLTSLISHLTARGLAKGGNPFLGEEERANPCIAILEGSYGAGYGALAYNSVLDFVRPLANGKIPMVIKTHNAAEIDEQVRRAKRAGCVALIAEIVRARDGVAISQAAWRCVLRACKKYNLILVVDEALTSIRCGAPFAYQLPQFQKHGFPDLVLFGKAVKTNGVAVEWRGVNMQKLGITDSEDRLFVTLEWQERLTEMAPAASLLVSWGTIVLAERERWPRRAREIGCLLRGLIVSEGIKSSMIAGLHSLIYLRVQEQARIRSPVMGANAGNYVRWFPTMDEVMSSEEELRDKVFGAGSVKHRRDVAAYLKSRNVRLGFCARCGQAVEAGRKAACALCVVESCEECEPGEHACPMEGMGGR